MRRHESIDLRKSYEALSSEHMHATEQVTHLEHQLRDLSDQVMLLEREARAKKGDDDDPTRGRGDSWSSELATASIGDRAAETLAQQGSGLSTGSAQLAGKFLRRMGSSLQRSPSWADEALAVGEEVHTTPRNSIAEGSRFSPQGQGRPSEEQLEGMRPEDCARLLADQEIDPARIADGAIAVTVQHARRVAEADAGAAREVALAHLDAEMREGEAEMEMALALLPCRTTADAPFCAQLRTKLLRSLAAVMPVDAEDAQTQALKVEEIAALLSDCSTATDIADPPFAAAKRLARRCASAMTVSLCRPMAVCCVQGLRNVGRVVAVESCLNRRAF